VSRVLLLNPPGSKNYIRDYFCSKLSKANYISPPIVMLTLSGILSETHEVMVLDAIVEDLSLPAGMERVLALQPDIIIALVGAASWKEDRAFLKKLKESTSAYLVAIGDLFLEDAERRMHEAPEIDAVLLNFVTKDILTLLSRREGQPIPNTIYRDRQGMKLVNGGLVKIQGTFRIPPPRHELFPLKRYRFPFMVAEPMTAMLTDYGCPFTCAFCVIPSLGFGIRPLADIIVEMKQLRQLGVQEIFFLDQTFGVRRERTLQLCAHMLGNGLAFKWSCFSRADVLDAEMLAVMAKAGCHTIIFGVESGNDETLSKYNKKMQLENVYKTLKECREAGIRVAATFMLGLPGEDEIQAHKTIQLALRLPLDYVAFNVAIPRAGTGLRVQATENGLIDSSVHTMDQSGIAGAMATRELTAEKILSLRRQAIRQFYLRPGYLLRRLFTIRSWVDLKNQITDGLGVLADALGWGK